MDDEAGVLGSRSYPQFLYLWNGKRVDLHGKILLGIPASDAAACGHTVAPRVELFQRLTPALSLPQTVSPCLLWVPCSQVLLCAK